MITYNELNKEQTGAADDIINWYFNDREKQIFTLVGYAGTGKTTLIKAVIQELRKNCNYSLLIKYVTYTGKASIVLTLKGLPATTIHSLMYIPVGREKKDGREIIKFEKKESIPDVDLIVIDEISTVPIDILEDLMEYNIKILAVGDLGQLPPVFGANGLVERGFDAKLKHIHRQAEGNPIIKLSKKVREGKPIRYGMYEDEEGVPKVAVIKPEQLNKKMMLNADQVICGFNRTRRKLNKEIRKELGFLSRLPQEGDKVICTYNNWNKICSGKIKGTTEFRDVSLVNGLVGYVHNPIRDIDNKLNRFRMDFRPEYFSNSYFPNLLVSQSQFLGAEDDLQALYYEKEFPNQFDFGYCISTHKSQGSQWDKVLLYNEIFRSYSRDKQRKWLYTGITRAKDRLILVTDENIYGYGKRGW